MFLPNIRCPHCNHPMVVAISGYGGELSNRKKECSKCGKEYCVQIFTTTTKDKEIIDGEISTINHRINYLNEERKELLAKRLIRYDVLKKLNEEALEEAREMKRKRAMN